MGNRVRKQQSRSTDEESTEIEESEQPLRDGNQTTLSGGEASRASKSEYEFSFGDIVHDREDDDPDDAVVVNIPDVTAEKWSCPDGKTLSEENPGYPTDDNVIVVVFRDTLDEYLPKWPEREDQIPLGRLDENEIPYYAFPSLRLELVETSGAGE